MFDPLIGREHALSVLGAETARAAAGHGGLVLVAGEAGIGKTALVTRAAQEAGRQGFLVLGGSCWDADNAPGHWPWVQVLRALRRLLDADEWAELERVAGHALGVLLGESDEPGGRGPKADGARGDFALFDALSTALVTAAQRRPVLVVIDDLHWADAASLRLLHFVAQHTWLERVLLVGTYRDAELGLGHEVRPGRPAAGAGAGVGPAGERSGPPVGAGGTAEPEAPVARSPRAAMLPLLARATSLSLGGLDEAEVGALIGRTVGREPDQELVAEVHRRTGGNPFFVEETARLWHAGGGTVPPGVADAVRRRVALLPQEVAELLRQAAVLGREFHRRVLAASLATPPARADRLLEAALTARLVARRGTGRFAFAHDLVRETLYAQAPEAETRRRHAAVVRGLDQQPELADLVVPADRARHALLAGEEVAAATTLALLRAAASDAGSRMAYDEELGHLRRAHELAADTDPRRRVLLGLELAECLAADGEWDGVWPYLRSALAESERLADPLLSARVALSLHGSRAARRGLVREVLPGLLAEAHGRLVPRGGDQPVPAPDDQPTLNRLARELAVRVAVLGRREGNDDVLAAGLWSRHAAIWGPGSADERAVLTQELAALARRTGDADLEHFATSLRWVALLELGDPDYLKQLREFEATVARLARPSFQLSALIDRAVVTALQGDFATSERLQRQAERLVTERRQDRIYRRHVLHLDWSRLLLRGQLGEAEELLGELPSVGYRYPELLEGITAAQRGDSERVCWALAAAGDGDQRYPGAIRSLWLRFQAQAAVLLGDRRRCLAAAEALAPVADQWAVSLHGFDVGGPFALWLGELAAALGDWEAAVARFADAARSAELLRARPWAAEARVRQAEALLTAGGPGAGEEAEALLRSAAGDAEELGMARLGERVREVGDGRLRWGQQEGEEAEFRFDGTVWTLFFAGRTVRLPPAKGLADLRELLARPGTDVPAARLLNPAGGEEVAAARSLGGDPVLDDTARAAYRRRLAELDAEIDRADARGDAEGAGRLDGERRALLAELRAAAGLGGRARRLGDEAERARKTVTARIRDTLRRLDERHPELAAHLRAAVTTGTQCGYHPKERVRWRL